MKRGLLWLLVPLALGAAVLSPCLPHQLHLLRLEQRFDAIEHPTGSRLVARESALGLLEGNGNHCDYFVGELRLSSSSEAELKTFYGSNVEFEGVDRAEAPRFMDSPHDRLLQRAGRTRPAASELLYVVWLFDQQPPGGDLRCH